MIYQQPKWLIDESTGTVAHFKGGIVEPGMRFKNEDFDIVMPTHYIPELVQFLTDKGYIKPQMSKESREEDLKIVHRLIDLLQNKATN